MKKATFKFLAMLLAAGLSAFILLCLLCVFYFNVPVHSTNPDGATEYKYEAGRRYFRGTEGFGYGRINNDGYNNLRDFYEGEPIDVLLMGSSHMEGFCVPQKDTAAAVLNRLFEGKKYVYNIGMAGHTFLYCAKRLDNALKVYKPTDSVVIELATLSYDPSAMDAAADGTLPDIPSHSGGLLTALQKLPFLRLFYTKYVKGTNEAVQAAAGTAEPVSPEDYEQALARLLKKISTVSINHGVRVILVYTPTVIPDADGTIAAETRPEELAIFERLCGEYGLVFLNLTERNIASVTEKGQLPFGFANTAPGQGHINQTGLRIFAEAVFEQIGKGET